MPQRRVRQAFISNSKIRAVMKGGVAAHSVTGVLANELCDMGLILTMFTEPAAYIVQVLVIFEFR